MIAQWPLLYSSLPKPQSARSQITEFRQKRVSGRGRRLGRGLGQGLSLRGTVPSQVLELEGTGAAGAGLYLSALGSRSVCGGG